LNKRLKTAKLETLKEIAEILKCDIHELIAGGKFCAFLRSATRGMVWYKKKIIIKNTVSRNFSFKNLFTFSI